MTPRFVSAGALALLLVAAFAWADEKDKKDDDAVAKAMSELVQLGPGVHKIKTDDKGRIVRCIVVGDSRISTVLGKAKGLEVARQRAQLAAKAEFVKWLKEKVSVHEKTEDEAILFLEGSKENDQQALKESGKAVEKTGKKIEAVADSLVRGMQVLHTEVSAKGELYSVVYGWDRQTSDATKKVREGLNNDGKEAKKPEAKEDKKEDKKVDGNKSADNKLEDKKATSKDAKKFIDP